MNNKIKVAMLPTGDKSCICMTKNKIYFYPQNNWFSKDYETQPLHLYVTVSQNVIGGKEVYYIDKFTNKVTSSGGAEYGENQDVVIATTDTKIHYKGEFNEKLGRKTFADVPQVSQSFLKEFVANPDGEYEVEYHFTGRCEDPMICLRGCSVYEGTCKHHLDKGIKLKLNKDNEVNITSVEELPILVQQDMSCTLGVGEGDGKMYVHGNYKSIKHLQGKLLNMEKMYSREEVESLLFQYAEDEHAWFSSKLETESFNDWIKENL